MLRSRAPSPATRAVLTALIDAAPAWSHGYELCRLTGLKSGTLYPLLIRLERQGYLQAEWQAPEPGRPPRHAYRLTAEGQWVHDANPSRRAGGGSSAHEAGVTLAERLVRLCLPWLPPHLRDWGEAMAREAGEVPGGLRAILFAAGCVVFAARVGIGGRMRAGLRAVMPVKAYGDRIPITALCEPRGFTLACAFTATTLGLVQLGASGAAHGMLVMNAMAFVAGLIMVFPLAKERLRTIPSSGCCRWEPARPCCSPQPLASRFPAPVVGY